MKNLINKKSINYILILVLSFTAIIFSACDPVGVFFKQEDLEENVFKVELINYKNPGAKNVNNTDLILPFDFDKMQILETLSDSKINDFINDISNIEMFDYSEYRMFADSANGISLKVNYKNGDFILLSSNFDEEKHYSCIVAIFDFDGEFKEAVGQFSWRQQYLDVVNKYFETKID